MKKFYLLFLFSLVCATASAQLVINEYMPNPSSTSITDPNELDSNKDGTLGGSPDEYIELVNSGVTNLDISGWKLDDGTDTVSPRHLFPNNTILPPGGAIIIFGGGTNLLSTDFGDSIVQESSGSTSLGLLNSGDTFNIYNDADVLQLTETYGAASLGISFTRSPDISGSFVAHPANATLTADGGGSAFGSPGTKIDGSSFISFTATDLVVNEFMPWPSGSSSSNTQFDSNGDGVYGGLDDEYIELINSGTTNLDITDWKINDGSDRHIFPTKTILPPGGVIIVFGGGTPTGNFGGAILQTATESTSLGLLNSGDTHKIIDDSGAIRLQFSYVGASRSVAFTRSPDITGNFILHTANTAGPENEDMSDATASPGTKLDGSLFYTATDLIINEYMPFPNGSGTPDFDANNDKTVGFASDEYIEFVNSGVGNLDISGWKINDITQDRHTFPVSTIIPAGGSIIVFGGGTPTGTFGDAIVQTASESTSLGLLNSGDAITIRDDLGNIRLAISYSSSLNSVSYTRSPDLTGNFIAHPTNTSGPKNEDLTDATASPGRKIDGSTFLVRNVYSGIGDWNNAGNWSLGLPTATSNTEIPSGASVTVTSDNETANNLEVKGTLVINTTESLTVNGSLEMSGTVTINSGGSLIVDETSLGDVTYNRTLSALNKWYLVASPVSGEIMTDVRANNSFVTNGSSEISFAPYDNSQANANDRWSYFGNTATDALVDGKGYSAQLSAVGDISFTGTVSTGEVSITLTQGGGSGNNFNLLANPFTSYINSGTFLTSNTGDLVQEEIYLWNQATDSYDTKVTADAFKVAPGQAFFVEANTTNDVEFATGIRSHETTDLFQKTSRTEVILNVTDGTSSRYAKIYYINGTTTGLDNGYDGKLFNGVPESFSLYTHLVTESEGKNYQIQSLPNTDFESMVVPVGVKSEAGKEITFTTESLNLPSGIKVFLEDREVNTFTRLDEAKSNYKVTLTTKSDGIGRFYLHTKGAALSTETISLENVSIYKTNNTNLRLTGLSQGIVKVKLFNILGKQVLNTSFNANGNNDVSLPNLTTGIYIVQLETATGKLNKKITLE